MTLLLTDAHPPDTVTATPPVPAPDDTGRPPPAPASAKQLRQPDTDTRTGIGLSAVNVVLFSLMSLSMWAGWGGWSAAAFSPTAVVAAEALVIAAINLGYGLLIVAATFAWLPRAGARARWTFAGRRAAGAAGTAGAAGAAGTNTADAPDVGHTSGILTRRMLRAAFAALALSAPRSLLLSASYSTPNGTRFIVAEWLAGLLAGFLAVAAGAFLADLVGRAQRAEADRLAAARRAALVMEELQTEEMRVRRMVADQLHGRLQFHLVSTTAALDAIARDLTAHQHTAAPAASTDLETLNFASPTDAPHGAREADLAQRVRELADRLDAIREDEVRSLSHAVFPAGVELGVARAIEFLVRRLPASVAVSFEVGETLREHLAHYGSPIPMADRLTLVYGVEEALSNALRHGKPDAVWVHIDGLPSPRTGDWLLEVVVDNDGHALPTAQGIELSGLSRHAERLVSRGGSLDLEPSPRGGARTRLRLPYALPS
jgi:two-component sensor histidine kinase